MRKIFFETPLIKWIWSNIFVMGDWPFIIGYLRRVRSEPFYGEERFKALMDDIKQVERIAKFSLLP